MNTQPLTDIETDDVDAIIRKNNYKLTADKIKQILSKVLNDPSQSAKRWVWELMQNAKDVKNVFGQVSIQIELFEDKLVFSHNGDPFKVANITGLIQQVSSKDSSNADEEVTGKFGTGFIATHLLSDIITVNGVVQHKGEHRSFEVVLDRSGRSSEELLPKIEKALEKVRLIESDPSFTLRPNYEGSRVESHLDTSFTYDLLNEEKRQAAIDGVKDLANTLPLTLVNVPKIKNVHIIDNISNTNVVYSRQDLEDDGRIRKSIVEVAGLPTQYLITYYSDELSLSVQVSDFDSLELLEHFGKTPNLYRDFPLIGSDKFYFPYVLNGYRLHPTEDRDGIPLHSESAPDHIENRQLIEKAFVAAKELTKYLLNQQAKNLFVCAYSRLPNEKWQAKSKEWYDQLQVDYRSFLNNLELVETQAGERNLLRESVIPDFGDKDEDKLKFYDVILPFVGKDKVPARAILLPWIKSAGPKDELDSWKRTIKYSFETFLQELANVGTLEALQNILGEHTTAITWLNEVYAFIIEYKEVDAFRDYAIIPNQSGIFQKLTPDTLHLEDKDANIPDEFLDILETLGDNWRTKLIHREVNLPGQNIEKKGLPLVSNRINELIAKDEFSKRTDKLKVIVDILRNVTSLSNTENFRIEIFHKGKDVLGFDESIRVVSNITDFRFNKALDIYIEAIHDKIQSFQNLQGLSTQLQKDKAHSIKWLNDYLNKILDSKEFFKHINYGNIALNQYENFCAYQDLRAFGTYAEPLDHELVSILKKLNPKEDWKSFLVIDGLDIKLTAKTFAELADVIDGSIREIEKEEAVNTGYINDFKNAIFELIEWTNNKSEKAKHLSHFMQRKNDLWVKFSMTDELLSLIKDKEALETLEIIQTSGISKEDIKQLADLFPDGLPTNVMSYAREEARKKKEFNNLLEVGSKVELAFIELLKDYQVEKDVVHAGGGAYDIRITNPLNNKSFYIEVKSCRFNNTDPINIAISQAKRAVKELSNENFGIVIIERPLDNQVNGNYIKMNARFFKNPGQYLTAIPERLEVIEEQSNTDEEVDLRMDFAEFKGSLDYNWIKEKTNNSGFNELISDIQRILS
ncbi:sacsin N-terminal ATP-binding-like domain-containing protein [Sphingobacterium multivorum]|uniref:sacsin N-terminal ATP-binding-like domain-containing protein n=1 Tax=Sphingobacterium multivorum TaxID=28454 RepID=UPI002FD9A8A9